MVNGRSGRSKGRGASECKEEIETRRHEEHEEIKKE
jgi:hypothetical protein